MPAASNDKVVPAASNDKVVPAASNDKVVPAASNATVTVIDDSTVLFSRDDGYKWRLGRTAALAGTNQVDILDGVQRDYVGHKTATLALDPDGNVAGLCYQTGAYYGLKR